MQKLDFTKQYKSYYSAIAEPQILEIEPVRYISIPGKGDPSGREFAEKLQALYPVAYSLKFGSKAIGQDFVVPKLEAMWSFDEDKYRGISMEEAPIKIPRSEWEYRLLLRLPDFADDIRFELAKQNLMLKKNISHVQEVELFVLPARKVVQMLHIGPFDQEFETLSVLKHFMDANGFGRGGQHHEIYLSDFRKTAPGRLKTILREPVTSH